MFSPFKHVFSCRVKQVCAQATCNFLWVQKVNGLLSASGYYAKCPVLEMACRLTHIEFGKAFKVKIT